MFKRIARLTNVPWIIFWAQVLSSYQRVAFSFQSHGRFESLAGEVLSGPGLFVTIPECFVTGAKSFLVTRSQ